ncbi:DUF1566 domain-containing protein [Sulfurimonas sp.]|nr:DUF1566 domain-containing protein [Sulfurimonas sp.]
MNRFLILTCILFFTTFSSAYEIIIDSSLSKDRMEFLDNNILEKNLIIVGNLMWQDNKLDKPVGRDWNDAKAYCEQLELGAYSDWYLPSEDELETIVDTSRYPPIRKEFNNVLIGSLWSSSEGVLSSSLASLLLYEDGNFWTITKNAKMYVRCARKIQ